MKKAAAYDGLVDGAWAAFVQWAYKQDEMRAAFERTTGMAPIPPIRNPLDAMIDEATGHTKEYSAKFVVWVTNKHWGWEYAPETFKAKHPK